MRGPQPNTRRAKKKASRENEPKGGQWAEAPRGRAAKRRHMRNTKNGQ